MARERLNIRDVNLAALDRILTLAREQGINTHLVLTPYLPAFFDGHPDAVRWKKEITDRAAAARLPVHDLTGAITDPALFRDRHHLNRAGARDLIRLLSARGVLAGHQR